MAQQGALPCHIRLPRSGASGAFVGGKGIARNGVRAVQSPSRSLSEWPTSQESEEVLKQRLDSFAFQYT